MTRRTFLGLLQAALLGSAAAVTPTESKAFDIDEGRRYDAQGRYQGREDASGRRYDAQGRYLGRKDSSGRIYDSMGRYQGREDSSGRRYDAQGRYQGRRDD